MPDEDRINPGHSQTRQILRIVGPLVLGAGVLLMIIGMGSFFSSMGSFGPPRYFWCCFAGMPLMFIGIVLTRFGFMGAVMRYQASEIAPVGKDTFNYMADGTREGVQTIASAVGAGLRGKAPEFAVECPQCGHGNDYDAKFCDDCGTAIRKACLSCGKTNDGDAKFCAECGTSIVR